MQSLWLRLRVFAGIFLVVIITGVVGFMQIEGLTPLQSLYFTIVTVGTVGYGDIVPKSPAGQVLTMFLIVIGATTFLGMLANLMEIFLTRHEVETRRHKLNIIIGVFFSEGGTELLRSMVQMDPGAEELRSQLRVNDTWTPKQYQSARATLKAHRFRIAAERMSPPQTRDFLKQRSELYLRLFENPYILEQEAFTELLRAVLHLREELLHRKDLEGMSLKDSEHLAGDMERVYGRLAPEWLDYMQYLQANYPYLFSLARRLSPFDQEAAAEVA